MAAAKQPVDDKPATKLPLTENRNPRTVGIDRMPTRDLVKLFAREDQCVPEAVAAVADEIAKAVEQAVTTIEAGGRIVYIGAGTSGRLGVLDASEMPPTFGIDASRVVGIIAGGDRALRDPVEGAEDDGPAAVRDLSAAKLAPPDLLVGISASGLAPYVRAGLAHANEIGVHTVLLSCNPYIDLPPVDVFINPVVGPEVITGSTRLKAGTACKLVLNTLSSATMIRTGKVYQNLMVDLRATNIKLRQRAVRIVCSGGNVPNYEAEILLADANGEVKTAIVMARKGIKADEARELIRRHKGVLFRALGEDADPAFRATGAS